MKRGSMKGKTKIYVAVVVLGLAALVIDRCFVGASGPQITAAEEVETDEDDAGEARPNPPRRPAPASATGKLSVPELHFPRELPTLDGVAGIRDLFQRPGRAIAKSPDGTGPATEDARKPPPAIGREAFSTAHHVDGVFVQERLKIAVVDGRWMRIGEELDHCTLIAIEGDTATFQCHDGDTILSPLRRKDARRD